jgi:primosomal protein N' (replication factor Y)
MRYAEVSVNSPAAQRRCFSYSIPPDLNVSVGQAVRVPFGSRVLEGIVFEITDFPAFEQTRDIEGTIEDKPVLSAPYLSLARWISDYYLSPLFDAVALMLPPGFERKSLTYISITGTATNVDVASLSEEQRSVMELLSKSPRLGQKQIDQLLGERKARVTVSQLINRGLISRSYELQAPRVKPKTEQYYSLAMPAQNPETLRLVGRSARQAALVEALSQQSNPITWKILSERTNSDRATLNTLVKKGIISVNSTALIRDPMADYNILPGIPHNLTVDQSVALDAIKSSYVVKQSNSPKVFLLHGVTGSGKTEVYLQALTEIIKLGKRGIVLVPEISLTPQTIERFSSRFPDRVAVLHSHLTLGEQYDEWHRIKKGEFDVVIGARSALFAPQPDLGLIIIDEEHEWTYKQNDTSPRYHARDAAIKLAGLVGATVVLGSATPDVGTYARALHGEFRLLSLPERVTPTENAPLPIVEVVDLKDELKSGVDGLFSRSLKVAVSEALSNKEQVILFLNRRGASTFIQCRQCGFVMRCRRCEVSLTYHSINDMLVCHQCNYHRHMPNICPQCFSTKIKFLGAGTQKLEEEANRSFAPARVLRWDSDATRGKGSHEDIMNAFVSHEADILIGTQMVAKGLDIPGVTVVGVINADIGLNLPHFLAAERTFQVLSQVAGRAGRGPGGGQVIFQTLNPEHFAIQAASKHDYRLFYEKEIAFRRNLGYPPFSRLASLVYSHTNDTRCQKEAERLKKQLEVESQAKGIGGLSFIGPAPAFIHRLRGRYRWQIILRGSDLSSFLAQVPLPRGWTVDIDPVGLV